MMRIIDAHCHIFPEKIAEKAVESIGRYYGMKMRCKGTVRALLESGERIGVEKYVVLSSATRVEQVEPINNFIAEVSAQNDKLIGFGTLHPDIRDKDAAVDELLSLKLRGIKLHPEFQNFSISDPGVTEIFRAAEGRLPLLIHLGDENKRTSSPDKLARVLDAFPNLVVIGAHLGGYSMWDEAMEHLMGRNLYLDTSSSLFKLESDKAADIIRRHGVEKVLFGTDFPMWGHEDELQRFDRLALTGEERELILGGNAMRLFNME